MGGVLSRMVIRWSSADRTPSLLLRRRAGCPARRPVRKPAGGLSNPRRDATAQNRWDAIHMTSTYRPAPAPPITASHSSAPTGHGTGASGLGGVTGQQFEQCGSGIPHRRAPATAGGRPERARTYERTSWSDWSDGAG